MTLAKPAASERAWALSFGTGSRLELRERLARLGDLGLAEREHRDAYTAHALAAELADERERDAAVTSDLALVAYERKWARRLVRLQRAHPARWTVPGFSDDELCAELTLRLIDTLRTKAAELGASDHRAGKEWGLLFLAQQRRALRASFRLKIVLEDPTPVRDRTPNEEERLLMAEAMGLRELARDRVEMSLTRPQRRWLSALKLSANAGAFFESSGEPNLAAASRLLGKHRSSAQRAFGELRERFTRELRNLDW